MMNRVEEEEEEWALKEEGGREGNKYQLKKLRGDGIGRRRSGRGAEFPIHPFYYLKMDNKIDD